MVHIWRSSGIPTAGMPKTSPSCVSSKRDVDSFNFSIVCVTSTSGHAKRKRELVNVYSKSIWSSNAVSQYSVVLSGFVTSASRYSHRYIPRSRGAASAMPNASLHITWISVRWRPAMSTNKPFLRRNKHNHTLSMAQMELLHLEWQQWKTNHR